MSDAAHLGPYMQLAQSILARSGVQFDQASGQMVPMRGSAAPTRAGGAAPPSAPMGSSTPPVSPATGTAGSTTTTSGGGGGASGYTPMASMPSPASGITPTSMSFYDLANQFTGN